MAEQQHGHHRPLHLRLPDGTLRPLTPHVAAVFGRGTPASLADDFLSREHVALYHQGDASGLVSLTNLGRNPIVVDVLQEGQEPAADGSWQRTALLQCGQDCRVAAGTRFFIAARADTTTFTLLAGAGGGGGAAAAPTAAPTAADAAAAAAEAVAVAAEAEARAQQLAADEALAAALAAEEHSFEELAAAVAAAEHAELPPSKRPRLQQEPGSSRGNGAGSAAAAASAAGGGGVPVPPPPALGDSPYALLAVTPKANARGAFEPAWNAGCLGARLTQLVDGPITLALVSNYMYEFDFFPQFCCPGLLNAHKVIIVEGHTKRNRTTESTARWQQEHNFFTRIAEAAFAAAATNLGCAGPGELEVHTPEVEPWGTHHSKFFLLRYATGAVRLIVHTANLRFHDCNSKTQGLWWQDFPPKQQQAQDEGGAGFDAPPAFEATLTAYLEALALPGVWAGRVAQAVAGADFSAARGVLIGSVPGRFEGPLRDRWGHTALRQALAATTLPARFRAAESVMQCSSLGKLDQRWVDEFAESLAAGHYEDDEDDALAAAAGGGAAGRGGTSSQQPRRPRLHFVWPTADEVRHSIEGWEAGRSIPSWSDKVHVGCLQQLFRRWGGEAVGRVYAMPHIKTFTRFLPAYLGTGGSSASATPSQQQRQQPECGYELPWWLVTSHNLSKAAWGSLEKSGKLYVRSFELGVLCLPGLEADFRRHDHRSFHVPTSDDARLPRVGVVPEAAGGPDGRVRFFAWNQAPPPPQQPPAGNASSSSQVVYIAVPYSLPLLRYRGNSDRPWCLDEHFNGVDRFGIRCPNLARPPGQI